MVSLKNIVFAKRTISLMAPLPCFSFVFQTIASSVSLQDFSLNIGNDFLNLDDNSALALAKSFLNNRKQQKTTRKIRTNR